MKYLGCKQRIIILPLALCCALLSSCVSVGDIATDSDQSSKEPSADSDLLINIKKGDDALSRGLYDDAQVQYALAVKEQPTNTELLYKLAFVHYQKGTNDVAGGLLERLTQQDSSDVRAYEMLGLIALKNENSDVAEANLLKATSLDSNRWRSLNALGILNDLRSNHTEAQSYFKKAGLLSTNRAQVENNLGYSYYLEGDNALAMQHFKKATQLDSNYAKAWSNLGLVLVRLKQYEEARFAFEKIVDESTAANNIGYLAMLQDDLNTANHELNQAIHLAPSHFAKANENLLIVQQRVANPVVKNIANEPDLTNIIIKPASFRPSDPAVEPIRATSAAVVPVVKPVIAETSEAASAEPIVVAAVLPAKTNAVERTPIKRDAMAAYSFYFLGFQDQPPSSSGSEISPSTIVSFQLANGLEPAGKLNSATQKRLNSLTNQRVQLYLDSLGLQSGSADGAWDEHSSLALQRFQENEGLESTGVVDAPTLNKLKLLFE